MGNVAHDDTTSEYDEPATENTESIWRRLIGPGLIVAVTGVGVGDLISSLNSGASFGLTLAWAVVIGVIVKYVVTEAIGRWHLVAGITPLRGFDSISRGFTWFFASYSVLIGFFYGASIASASGLIVNAMLPSIPFWVGATVTQVIGTVLVLVGRYGFFEKFMMVFVGLMFISVIGAAILSRPSLDTLLAGFVPSLGTEGAFYVLGIIGGVGMSIGLLSYGRWMAQRGWQGAGRVRAMRIDLVIAYVMTFVFMVSMMVVGASFVSGASGIQGVDGISALAEPFGDTYGPFAKWLLLVGMFSAVFSSLVGGYNALSNVFTDIVHVIQRNETELENTEKTKSFRIYLFWMAGPPLLLLGVGQPVIVVLTYAALGALFMPVLIAGLLVLLNSKRMPKKHRNRWWMNLVFAGCLSVYAVLGINELINLTG